MWLIAAIATSAAIVLSGPVAGQLRTSLRAFAGDQFTLVMAAVVIGAIAAAAVAGARQIGEDRRERYTALVVALLIAAGYAVLMRSGNADVDAVERFHFVQYGLVTFLFYKARRRVPDRSVFIVPLLAAFMVGTFEEWLQWFVPGRVGEARDVLLNLVAIACALLFCAGVDPPRRPVRALSPASRRELALLSSGALIAFGGFFHAVHLGHEITDREAGVFRSRYTADRLAALAADRTARWRTAPPVTRSRYSREDQYFSEGVAHVHRRNQNWHSGQVLAARHENLILERYYAPVLDTPSYVSATGHRWSDAQRAQAHSLTGPGFMIYDSDALPYPVLTWPPWAWWTLIAMAIVAALRWLARPAARQN